MMEVEVVLIGRHCEPVGQQKSDGKLLGHCESAGSPPQVEASRLVCKLLPASGSNSSGIQSALAETEGRRYESARANA